MRLLVPGALIIFLTLPVLAQYPETGGDSDGSVPLHAPRAQPVGSGNMGDPGATQDAEAQREKLLHASDQLDAIEANSETTKAAVDGMKADLTRLAGDNQALKAQVATLQDTITHQQEQIDALKASQLKERQAIIDEVAALVASKPAHHATHATESNDETPAPKHHADDEAAATPAPHHAAPSLAPPPDDSQPSGPVKYPKNSDASFASATAAASTETKPAAPTHEHKGYYHVVAPHETLSLIAEAYRDHGVNVTVTQIRHANGLSSKSELKVGQKLFIPKPGA